ncbi:MAG: pantoate--beta-alanine ligase [Acidimicrobiales bacterium]|jgi:pantoate--beta-alanine ligase
MDQLSSIEAWRNYANDQRAFGHRVALVPTMGALHDGHASLFRAAKASGDVVIATIFVNPRQFGNAADLKSYPRTPHEDAVVAKENGVDCVVEPSLEEMWPDYPNPTSTTVSVHGLGDTLEGADRSGHFDGVASVVIKLFAVTGPCHAYFGEKDYQQLAVVRQMVRDLALPVEIIGCPIVRDPDGLAISSRNGQLSVNGREQALAISRALRALDAPATPSTLCRRMREVLDDAHVKTAYAEVVHPATFVAARDGDEGEFRALIAGIVEGVRLIDNAPVILSSKGA